MSLSIGVYGELIWWNEEGNWHREKGPALISTGHHVSYLFNGKYHRLDGPAIIRPSGDKFYCIYDIHYPKEEYYAKVKKL